MVCDNILLLDLLLCLGGKDIKPTQANSIEALFDVKRSFKSSSK